jgi:hypothetical protein
MHTSYAGNRYYVIMSSCVSVVTHAGVDVHVLIRNSGVIGIDWLGLSFCLGYQSVVGRIYDNF